MKRFPRFAVLLLAAIAGSAAPSLSAATRASAVPDADPASRGRLVQAVLSDGAERQQHLHELASSGSKQVQVVLTAWMRGEVYLFEPAGAVEPIPVMLEEQQDSAGRARAIRIDNGEPVTDAQGHERRFEDSELTPVDTDARLRRDLRQTLDELALADPDPDTRRSAVVKLGNAQNLSYVPVLESRLAGESDADVIRAIHQAIATLQLGEADPAVRIAAAQTLARLDTIGAVDTLKRFVAASAGEPAVARAGRQALKAIEEHIGFVNFFGTLFRGISLGSVLLVVALGLAVTFGLMGVINMAHGEMIAVGAYTAYLVENIFGSGLTLPFFGLALKLPGLHAGGWFYQSYFLVALPLSFLAAALAGVALERTVIRFLYRRPLESLLATWGVSLVMQQSFRMIFGANNVQVNSPSWLLGHFSVHDVAFGYNRVFVVAFAIAIVLGTWLLLTKTPLGLLIRSVMQNRRMAACLGVRTERVNVLTFAFGSGLAGLAGAFLSQIGNVGPSLGQSYIVDSFMTVVVGGVGSLVGTVCSALAIGTSDQVLQQLLGSPVLGKIIVLGGIILFLQWKPGGLFAIRSRTLD
jgi:urea transport system permease protein